MDKNTMSLLAVIGLAAGLIYLGKKPEPEEPETEDSSIPTAVDYEDKALKEALNQVSEDE